MKKFNLKSLVTSACLFVGACTSTQLFATEASSVWKVSKGGDSIYVGGTIHMLPVSEFPLPSPFTKAYQDSDTVVLEAKLPDPSDTEAQMAVLKAMSFESGRTLKDVVSNETYARLEDYVKGFGVNLQEMAKFKPSFILSMLVAMEAQKANMAGSGVDAYFAQLAARDNKPAEYLETMEFQLNMLANQGVGEEDRMITTNLDYMPEIKTMLTSIIRAWRAGDNRELEALVIDKMKKESPESFKSIMLDRNEDWVPKIEAMFGDEDKEFVLVGVGHLVGTQNVLELLQTKGYQVEQL